MSDNDKMMVFGRWLHARLDNHKSELFALSVNRNHPIDAIRIKAGHIEATADILATFGELYRGDLTKFMEEHLGQKPEEETDKESTNDQNTE